MRLTDKKLSSTVNDPFNAIIETKKKALSGLESSNWCRVVDVLQTSAIALQDDYNLKELVSELELSGDLITA